MLDAFRAGGGDFDAGRQGFQLRRDIGLEPHLQAEFVALEPGHPHLRLPVQFAASLRSRLLDVTLPTDLDVILSAAEES